MENFGKRLKEERERLGLSQSKLGELCGVGKTAQYTYETGDRFPSSDYLFKAGASGVDVGYLLFRARTTPKSVYSLAARLVLPKIAARANLDSAALLWILDLAAESESNLWGTSKTDILTTDELDVLINALFDNGQTLSAVIAGVQEVLHTKFATPPSLSVGKHYKLVVMLYRSCTAAGKVDLKIIEEAVTLVVT